MISRSRVPCGRSDFSGNGVYLPLLHVSVSHVEARGVEPGGVRLAPRPEPLTPDVRHNIMRGDPVVPVLRDRARLPARKLAQVRQYRAGRTQEAKNARRGNGP